MNFEFKRPSYDNDVGSLSYLAQIQGIIKLCIQRKNKTTQEDITLNITNCNYISPSILPIIGSFGKLLMHYGIHGSLSFHGSNNAVIEYITQSGLYTNYTGKGKASENAIPFTSINNIEEALLQIEQVMQKAPVTLSLDAEDEFSSKLLEIFLNAFGHSKSLHPIYSCGYWRSSRNTLTFSIYDLGVGIPFNVRQFFGATESKINDIECIKQAIKDGFTTANDPYPRGLGLGVLIDFVKLNGGSMTLCSGKGYYYIDNISGERFEELSDPLLGTLFTIDIKADTDHIYSLVNSL